VAFASSAPLTGINTGSTTQIFLRDRNTNVTTMISVNDLGDASAGGSGFPAISGNGRFVAFVSNAPNLVSGDTNNRPDVFVHDTCFAAPGLCTPGTTRVSVATGGVEVVGGMSDFFTPSINDDGRFVVFTSSATDLVPNDTNASIDVFIHDRLASPVATTTRVSLTTTGAQFFGSTGTVSADGRFVAFEAGQAFVYDTCFGAASCTPGSFVVSRVPGGANANFGAGQPAISGDARYVVFQSPATNLLPGITTAFGHIYRARTN
jgi:Tol biopolymer transport system component